MLDGRAQREVQQAIGVVARVAPHEVERKPVDARRRHELAHGCRRSVGRPDHRQHEAGISRVEDPAEHHREAPLVLALPAQAHQSGELLGERGVEVGRIVEGGGVAVLLDPVVGLAQPLHVLAGQCERLDLHHRLVAEVDVVHPRVAVDGQPLLAGAHHRGGPAVVVGELAERPPHLLALVQGTDGIGGDEADPAVDGVGDQAVAMEEPLLVRPQGEVVECRGAVAAHDVAGPELRGPARGQSAVDHRPRQQEQSHHHQGQPDGQEGRGEKTVGPLGERHRGDADESLGHRPQGRPPRDGGLMVLVDMGEEFDGGGGDHGDADHADHQRQQRRSEGRGVGGGLELLAVGDQQHQDGQCHQRFLEVGAGHDVQEDGASQQCHRHPPGPPLAAEDTPAKGDQGKTGHGDEGTGSDTGAQGEELLHRVQPPPQRRGDGIDQVDDPGQQDGGGRQPAHPPGPAMGLAQVGRRGPRVALGIRGHERRMERPGVPPPGDHPLEEAGRGEVGVTQQHPDVQFGSGLQLDPAHPPAVQEDRGKPQPAAVLLHHLSRGPDVGVEAHTEVGELGLERGRRDQAGVAVGDQSPGVVPGRIVGPPLGLHRMEGAAAQDRPHAAAEQAEHQRHDHQDHQGHQ